MININCKTDVVRTGFLFVFLLSGTVQGFNLDSVRQILQENLSDLSDSGIFYPAEIFAHDGGEILCKLYNFEHIEKLRQGILHSMHCLNGKFACRHFCPEEFHEHLNTGLGWFSEAVLFSVQEQRPLLILELDSSSPGGVCGIAVMNDLRVHSPLSRDKILQIPSLESAIVVLKIQYYWTAFTVNTLKAKSEDTPRHAKLLSDHLCWLQSICSLAQSEYEKNLIFPQHVNPLFLYWNRNGKAVLCRHSYDSVNMSLKPVAQVFEPVINGWLPVVQQDLNSFVPVVAESETSSAGSGSEVCNVVPALSPFRQGMALRSEERRSLLSTQPLIPVTSASVPDAQLGRLRIQDAIHDTVGVPDAGSNENHEAISLNNLNLPLPDVCPVNSIDRGSVNYREYEQYWGENIVFNRDSLVGALNLSEDARSLYRGGKESGNACCFVNGVCQVPGQYSLLFVIESDKGASTCLGVVDAIGGNDICSVNSNVYLSARLYAYRSFQGMLYVRGREQSKRLEEFWMDNTLVNMTVTVGSADAVVKFQVNSEPEETAFTGLRPPLRPVVAFYAGMKKRVTLLNSEFIAER